MHSWLYSDTLRDLLDEIQTIEALDVMCTVAREPTRRWGVSELPGTDGMALADSVRHLVARGLLTRHDDGTVQLASADVRQPAIDALGRLCDEDRPNVLGAIAQRSIDRIRTSAARTLVRCSHVDTDIGDGR